MGKVVMPKNSAVPEEIKAALKIYYDANDWLKNDEFTQELKNIIGGDQYHSSYTKKVQMLSYFGFTTWEDFSKAQSRRKITDSGKRFYEAWKEDNKEALLEELMYSLEHTVFGRNNCGVSDSDSDVEIPSVFIRTVLEIEYLTYSEFAYLLWQMEDCGMNYTDAVNELKKTRNQDNLSLTEEAKKYTDAKPIMMLIRWGFLAEDGKIGASTKIVVSEDVLSKFRKRVSNLKIYNVDKNLSVDEITKVGVNFDVKFKTGLESKFCRNRILFGAPGTGKSFTLNEERKDLLGNDSDIDYERVTFHPDYSYANFVGTYKPVMVKAENWVSKSTGKENVLAILLDESKTAQEKYDLLYDTFKDGDLTRLPLLLGLYSDDSFTTRKKDGTTAVGDNSVERNHGKAIRPYVNLIDETISTNEISYEYVPGPFMRVYVEALKNARTDNPKPFLLIIEEINRANVAAVFGGIFQLLDRGDDEVSEYPIQASEDIKKYLARELGGEPEQYNKIKIPDNMFIWATMNSADQGVFPMDTAFKRRWDFTYLGIDDSEKDLIGKTVVLGEGKTKHQVEWNKLRKAINKFLAKNKINEDKQLGPYFISKKIVVPSSGDEIERDAFINTFKHKAIMYLFEDAAKQKRSMLFEGCFDVNSRYSEICKEFDLKGIGIFNSEIQTAAEPMDLLDAVEESTVEENAE
jgi:GTPase subunit of restriction endonuclease